MLFASPEIFQQADKYLSSHQQELLKDTQTIFKRLELRDGISDYSFLVSPVTFYLYGMIRCPRQCRCVYLDTGSLLVLQPP